MNHIGINNHPEILLVDDSPEQIETAVSVLKKENFRIRIALNGSIALKLIRMHPPDLILLDVYMPGMNGFDVCREIKTGNFKNIPVIFLTSSSDEKCIKKGFEYGANDYVIKPFNSSELLARVNTHIKLKEQADSLMEANRELDSFCYSVSHDLKAPLLSINKLVEYLESDYIDNLDTDGKEIILNIREKSREVISIIDHLLEFSKMYEMHMNICSIDMNDPFRQVFNELIKLQPSRKVRFNVGSLPLIQGDPVMIRLLVQNILSNALKYTNNREETIIEACVKENENEYIFSIKDNGVGFDMRYSSRLFGVFQRLHSHNEFEGSGVGLAICQRILKRHGGKAWLTGEVDKGAVFYFSFPKDLQGVLLRESR